MLIKVDIPLPCNPTKLKERSTRLTSWKVAIFILAQDFFMKVKFLIFLQIPLFFHDTDGVKKKEGKVNIKLSFVWLLGGGKMKKRRM